MSGKENARIVPAWENNMPVGKSVLFVGDGGNSPILAKQLSALGYGITFHVEHPADSTTSLRRHLCYLKLALAALRKRKRYDGIFFWQQYVALYYYLLSQLWPFHQRPICIYYILYKKYGMRFAGLRLAIFQGMIGWRWTRKVIL
jgi:hypothetical protein